MAHLARVVPRIWLVVLLLAVLVLVTLTACGAENRLTEGVVTGKEYDDPDDWYEAGYTIDGGQSCSGGYGDQPRRCVDNPDTYVPGEWHHDPAHWFIYIEGPDPDHSGDDAPKRLRERHEVSERSYYCIKAGDYWDLGKDPCEPG